MAFKISGTTVIDDNCQIIAAGIATIGSGSSATILTDSGVSSIGAGITMDVTAGNVSIAGTIDIASFAVTSNITGLIPSNGSTIVSVSTSITITYDKAIQFVSAGTTSLTIGVSTLAGDVAYTYDKDSDRLDIQRNVLTILPPTIVAYGAGDTIFIRIPPDFLEPNSFSGTPETIADGAYSFTFDPTPIEGQIYQGGYVICVDAGSSCAWTIAPPSAQLGRDWFSRNDANTCAQTVTGYSGWFIASASQWQNPGYSCRANWPYNPGTYWTNTQIPTQATEAYYINMSTGTLGSCWPNDNAYSGPGNAGTPAGRNVRSFRCISY